MDNQYLLQLTEMLKQHYASDVVQKGNNDLTNGDCHVDTLEKFYQEIMLIIINTPPHNHVKSLNVYLDSKQNIQKIEYNYCDDFECINFAAINFFWN